MTTNITELINLHTKDFNGKKGYYYRQKNTAQGLNTLAIRLDFKNGLGQSGIIQNMAKSKH
jgi:hypothetical protein